jgi:hypothetical protein
MLFILVMDVLGHVISKASEEELLHPLARRALQHRISLYVDNVVLFLQPEVADIAITVDILQLFRVASRLKTNLQKSNVLPIRCGDHELEVVQHELPCVLSEFLCKYLGFLLSLKKLKREHLQPIIDRMADQLLGWKADLLTRAGRKVHVQFVLTLMLIYLTMAVDLPQWAHKAMDKIRRSYFWRGHKEAKGGHCLVAWDTVCYPLQLGGLGISNLKNMGWALRVRWLWLQKTEPHRSWSSFVCSGQYHSGPRPSLSFLCYGHHFSGWKQLTCYVLDRSLTPRSENFRPCSSFVCSRPTSKKKEMYCQIGFHKSCLGC